MEGVGAVSSFRTHSGGVEMDGWAGRASVGPRVRAPPVRGEMVHSFAGCGGDGVFGGSRDAG